MANEHDTLVEAVKSHQRSSEIAREGWRHYCGAFADGIRDPQKHSSEFLRSFLEALEAGLLSKFSSHADSLEPRLVRSCCPSLGSNQLELLMPESEISVMKDVVNANCYGFAPGKGCLLSRGDIVLDIGAHLGLASALALQTAGVSVICVEPHPVSFKLLEENLNCSRAILVNVAVSDVPGERQLYAHQGTNNPSRLFFSSLFATRAHAENALLVQSLALQDLILTHTPTVVKIDAEGAERFLTSVHDFLTVRCMVVEWDWTHNTQRSCWEECRSHLEALGFKLSIRGHMPDFDATGHAVLTDKRGKKRGNTGMVFVASRKPEHFPSLGLGEVDLRESERACRGLSADYLFASGSQPPLALQFSALSTEQMEARLAEFGEAAAPVEPSEFFVLGFMQRRRSELVTALCAAYEKSQPRALERSAGTLLPEAGVERLMHVLSLIKFDQVRPSLHASGYITLKASQAAKHAKSWGEDRLLGDLWSVADSLLRQASAKAAAFDYTAMAITKNFRGSPHIDQNDLSVQYAMSVGDFESGGELCVEESPCLVRALDTRNRLVCIDGRYPHWVSGYAGERYSIIFYRSFGQLDPPTQAVHSV